MSPTLGKRVWFKGEKSIYEEIEGWNEDITQVDNYHDLPDNFKKYVTFLEKNLELEIKIVSVGPNRKQTIIR